MNPTPTEKVFLRKFQEFLAGESRSPRILILLNPNLFRML